MAREAREYRGEIDAVILTIREDEHEAVKARLGQLEQVTGDATYHLGRIQGRTRTLMVAVHRIPQQGNGPAQHAASAAISDFNPKLILLVGIAGAVPSNDFSLGDVIVATSVADLRVQALDPDDTREFDTRTAQMHQKLVERLANLSPLSDWASRESIRLPQPSISLTADKFTGHEKWNDKLRKSLTANFGTGLREPRYVTGQIASQDSLVKDPAMLERWRKTVRKVEAIEMEAAGVTFAACQHAQYPVLVIRGLSDVVGYVRDDEWTRYACSTAAAFAIALLTSKADPILSKSRRGLVEPRREDQARCHAEASRSTGSRSCRAGTRCAGGARGEGALRPELDV